MAVNVGTNPLVAAYLGTTALTKICLGAVQLWPTRTPASVKGTPQVSATTSVTLPAHAVGDIIVIWAYASGSNTAPSKPTASGTVPNWTAIDAPSGGNSNAGCTYQFIATATNHTSGTWSGANAMIAVVVTGNKATSPIGGHATAASAGGGTSCIAPAITLSVTDGSSLILHLFGERSVTSWATVPSGYTRWIASGVVCLNTKIDSTSDGACTQPGVVNNAGRGATIEVLAA